jgi:hypothetical protein
MAPRIIKLGTILRCSISFSGRFIPEQKKKKNWIHWIKDCVGPIASLDLLKRNVHIRARTPILKILC